MDKGQLDDILIVIGRFGKYQKSTYFIICLLIIFSVFQMSYIFTSRSLKHRCFIEGCDDEKSNFSQTWLRHAVPFKDEYPESCDMFQRTSSNATTCDLLNFNSSAVIKCEKFFYETEEVTIAKEFNITCPNNLWKLTLAGTINNIGELVCLPFSGFISDKYGRRIALLICVTLSTAAGLIRSFAPNYLSYVAMEFLDTALGSGFYSAGFILGIELVVPEKRVLGNTILSVAFALGEVILGLVAWSTNSWRIMLRILYSPGVLLILYSWYAPESIRWLLSNGNVKKAKDTLAKVARINGRTLTNEVLDTLVQVENPNENIQEVSITQVFKSAPLLFRMLNCCFSWICCTFIYYGISMHSVSISGNLYLNYIIVALIEMPAYLVTYFTLDKYGRRITMALSLLLAGVGCISFIFIEENKYYLKMSFFLLGKFCITIGYTILYMYTTEMFPTCLRHSFLSFCSMFGRFGSMMAPQVPLLASIYKSLPLIMFSVMALAAGILAFHFPETHNIKLPDTIEEAVSMGRRKLKVNT